LTVSNGEINDLESVPGRHKIQHSSPHIPKIISDLLDKYNEAKGKQNPLDEKFQFTEKVAAKNTMEIHQYIVVDEEPPEWRIFPRARNDGEHAHAEGSSKKMVDTAGKADEPNCDAGGVSEFHPTEQSAEQEDASDEKMPGSSIESSSHRPPLVSTPAAAEAGPSVSPTKRSPRRYFGNPSGYNAPEMHHPASIQPVHVNQNPFARPSVAERQHPVEEYPTSIGPSRMIVENYPDTDEEGSEGPSETKQPPKRANKVEGEHERKRLRVAVHNAEFARMGEQPHQ